MSFLFQVTIKTKPTVWQVTKEKLLTQLTRTVPSFWKKFVYPGYFTIPSSIELIKSIM